MNSNHKTIALFPGSFKPPHPGHIRGLQHLIDKVEVDEILILISNRSRILPGTTQALDAHSSAMAWKMVLGEVNQKVKPIRVEIASFSAIDACKKYVGKANPGKKIFLCLGHDDHDKDDRRFDELRQKFPDKNLETIVLPTGCIKVRASDLRFYLSQGDRGKADFIKAFKGAFIQATVLKLWRVCMERKRSVHQIRLPKLKKILEAVALNSDVGIYPVDANNPCSRYYVQGLREEKLWIHYAGDEVDSSRPDTPRERIATAVRALRQFTRNDIGLVLPELILFDRESHTLIHTDVMPGSKSLKGALSNGAEARHLAGKLGAALANLHTMPTTLNYLRGNEIREQKWWKQQMQLVQNAAGDGAQTLLGECQAACRRINMLFLRDPQCYRVLESKIGISDLSNSSSLGDPAFDIAYALFQLRPRKCAPIGEGKLVDVDFLRAYQAITACDDACLNRALSLVELIHFHAYSSNPTRRDYACS